MILDIYKNAYPRKQFWKSSLQLPFWQLSQSKRLETKNILINQKNYKDLVIYFTRYGLKNSIKLLRLYYNELLGKIEEHEEKKYLMVDDYMLDKVLHKIKEIIDIEQFDYTNILIDSGDKLPDDITVKNVVILITCIIKDDGKFNPQIFLVEALFVK